LIKGNRPKCSGYWIQTKTMYIIETMLDVKLADILGIKRKNI
jgi:hypothetical protein